MDGAVNASLLAIICFIFDANACCKSSGVSASIALSQSSSSIHSCAEVPAGKVLVPILDNS